MIFILCCCGLLVALVLSRTLCKPEPKESNEPTAVEQNQDIMFTESEQKNLQDFNIALYTFTSFTT